MNHKQYIVSNSIPGQNTYGLHIMYFGQFVDDRVKRIVKKRIGIERILMSKDKHLNDIPLKEWDMLENSIKSICLRRFTAISGQGMSLSDCVCIAKEAARQLKDSYK